MASNSAGNIIILKCMDYDELAWKKCDNLFEPWKNKIFDQNILRNLVATIDKHRGGVPDETLRSQKRGFQPLASNDIQRRGLSSDQIFMSWCFSIPGRKLKHEIAVCGFVRILPIYGFLTPCIVG
jgi:hypothetical protein